MTKKRTFSVAIREEFGNLSTFHVKGHKIAIVEVGDVQGWKALSFSKVRFIVDRVEITAFSVVWVSEMLVEERIIDVYDTTRTKED